MPDRKIHQPPAAVALCYKKHQEDAPRLIAKGRGAVARKIMEVARASDVPVLMSPQLANLLMSVELEDPIPESAFGAVAEIYAFLVRLDEKYEQIVS